jgi:PIN domain nuclease of toxin-antitoxin system
MNLLLDTCTLLWWWSEPRKLSKRSISLLRDPYNKISVSAASAWEIATKHRIGKYPQGEIIISEWNERISVDRFSELLINCAHALKAGSMPGVHRDPFDRMIAAQSLTEGLPVLTPDALITELGAETIW